MSLIKAYFPSGDAHNLGRVHANLAISDNDAQVFNGGFIKGALFWFEVEIKLSKVLQDSVCEVMESGKRIMKDEDIIKVDDNMAVIEEVFKDVIYEGLKGCWGITEAKGHSRDKINGMIPGLVLWEMMGCLFTKYFSVHVVLGRNLDKRSRGGKMSNEFGGGSCFG